MRSLINEGIHIMQAMSATDLSEKRVLIREDLNVAIKNGKIIDDTRIKAALPTIKAALAQNAKVIVMSHLGRPTEGVFEEAYSLRLVALSLSAYLNQPVRCIPYDMWTFDMKPGEVVLLENTRFYPGEKANDPMLAQRFASLCDVFVMDAFATAHRAHASTAGVATYAPETVAGPLLLNEVNALDNALKSPKKPLVAIVGGSKLSTKFGVLKGLLAHVDTLIVGGGIANTLLAAKGYNVGASLVELDFRDAFLDILKTAEAQGKSVPVPVDVRVAKAFAPDQAATIKRVSDVEADDMILDIGPETEKLYTRLVETAGTIIWNGPLGVFEFPAFKHGTVALAHAIANSPGYSLAGGGETIAAINQSQIADQIDTISTGGGAFLEYLEGKPLPGLVALNK